MNQANTGVNPYNFIHIGDRVQRTKPPIGSCCGKIRCTLLTKTPLCLPDAEYVRVDTNQKMKDGRSVPKSHQTMPFFTIDEKPVITGSELRGMLRSEFEAITNSCMSILSENFGVPTEYQACKNADEVCEACALFGMLGERGSKLKSKLRFTDAKADRYTMCRNKTLKILGGPNTKKGKNYFDTAQNGFKVIKGRKFYYHSDTADWFDNTLFYNNQTITTDVMDKESSFHFDVYFNGITEKTLQKVVWLLCLGENTEDSKQMHKIGHGKPLGLGSVKIIVDGIDLRTYTDDAGQYAYKMKTIEKNDSDFKDYLNNPYDTSSRAYQDFMAITNFDCIAGRKLDYLGELPSLSKSTTKPYTASNKKGSYRKNDVNLNKGDTDKITVQCETCGKEFQINRISYDTLTRKGIPIKCWDCRK